MGWLTILLLGVAANIDNLGISVSYGLNSKKIPLLQNLLIAFISMMCAFISISAGSFLSEYFSESIANIAGGILIIGLGVYFIISSGTFNSDNEKTDQSTWLLRLPKLGQEKDITWKETVFLGFVLGLNCLTIGFGAGFTGVSAFSTSISIGIFSIISIFLGVMLGKRIGSTVFGRYSTIISGVLLIIIGIYEIII